MPSCASISRFALFAIAGTLLGCSEASLINQPKKKPPFSVTTITPNSGTKNGGTTVTVNGAGFVTGMGVTIGGVACINVNVVSANVLTCDTQAHAPGIVDVVFTHPRNPDVTVASAFTYKVPLTSTQGFAFTSGGGYKVDPGVGVMTSAVGEAQKHFQRQSTDTQGGMLSGVEAPIFDPNGL